MALGAACAGNQSREDTKDKQQHTSASVMTASQASTARDSLLFPLQFTSTDDGPESLSDAHASDQYDPVVELQKIQRALGSLSEGEMQLAQAVQEAKAGSILTGGSVDLWAVGSYLRSKYGYLVVLRRANISKRPKAYLRQLRHDFLVVRGLPTLEAVDILVDLNFRDHFRVCHATPWYTKMLAALPHDWVGSAAALAPIVGLMSAGIRLCFRQAGIPLPPWREGRAMLSKWVTELHSDEQLPVVPLPDAALRRLLAPYHTPFRTAVQQAGGAPAAATPPPAGVGHFVSTGTASADKQQAAAAAGQGQQSSTGLLSRAGLPPLPPACSSSSTAAAAAVAAAAAAAKPGQHDADAAAGRDLHHHLVPDVPRKIIVGFPVASPPSAQQQQLLVRLDLATVVGGTPAAAVDEAAAHGRAAIAAAVRQPQQLTSLPQPQQEQQRDLSRAGIEAATAQVQAAAAAARVKSGPALAEVSPGSRLNIAAAAAAAAATGSNQLHSQHRSAAATAPGAAAAAATSRPAFSSTAGVVVSTAGGTSPGIVVSKHWVQQLTQGAMTAAATATAGDDKCRGKAGTTADGEAAAGSNSNAGGAAATAATEPPPPAAAAAAPGVRQFKSLDQLLPRMRTVKLGAG